MYDIQDNRMFPVDEADVKEHQRAGRIKFEQGEIVNIKGVDFVIFNLTDRGLVLRVVKQNKVTKIA